MAWQSQITHGNRKSHLVPIELDCEKESIGQSRISVLLNHNSISVHSTYCRMQVIVVEFIKCIYFVLNQYLLSFLGEVYVSEGYTEKFLVPLFCTQAKHSICLRILPIETLVKWGVELRCQFFFITSIIQMKCSQISLRNLIQGFADKGFKCVILKIK